LKLLERALISPPVCIEFFLPKFTPRLRQASKPTASMLMPEAPMNENCLLSFAGYDVGTAGQLCRMQ
jgi:hypothetical protein